MINKQTSFSKKGLKMLQMIYSLIIINLSKKPSFKVIYKFKVRLKSF